MSNYQSLKATIDANIKRNGRQEITGQVLNSVLNALLTSLGSGYQFMGLATPSGQPTPGDKRVVYLTSEAGTYTNYGGIVVTKLSILYYDTAWHKSEVDIPFGGSSGAVWGSITGTLQNQTDLKNALNGKQDTISDLSTIRSGAASGATAYQKPSTGIPKTDLASGVQTSLGKADTALQSVPSSYDNNVVHKTGNERIAGAKVFEDGIETSYLGSEDGAYFEFGSDNVNVFDADGSPASMSVKTPTADIHAATKGYVDGKDSNAVHKTGMETIHGEKTFADGFVSDLLAGKEITLMHSTSETIDNIDIDNISTEDDYILGLKDDNAYGNVIVRGIKNPTQNNDAANKSYVDTGLNGKANDSQVVKVVAQSLTSADQLQARTNIDVYSKAETNALVGGGGTWHTWKTINADGTTTDFDLSTSDGGDTLVGKGVKALFLTSNDEVSGTTTEEHASLIINEHYSLLLSTFNRSTSGRVFCGISAEGSALRVRWRGRDTDGIQSSPLTYQGMIITPDTIAARINRKATDYYVEMLGADGLPMSSINLNSVVVACVAAPMVGAVYTINALY